mgnify:CR=1 FL=1
MNDLKKNIKRPEIVILDQNKNIETIYHIADIHIRKNSRHQEYQEVFDKLCLQILKNGNLENSLIVICGDIVHSKTEITPELINIVKDFFIKLSNLTDLIVILGNHDINCSNMNRLDAISPIIKNNFLTKNKIHLLLKSGVYEYGNILFGHTSLHDTNVTDINNYSKIRLENKIKIGLYHGTLMKSLTDSNFRFTNNKNFDVDDFDNYDIVMLGDIHKWQFLDNSNLIAYAGSLIQQNYGETLSDHGMIQWYLAEKSGTFVPIQNDYGFVTLNVTKDGLIDYDENKFPKYTRLKIIYKDIYESEIDEIIKKLKLSHNIIELKYVKNIWDENNINTNTSISTLINNKFDNNNLNIINRDMIKKIINEYLKKINETYDINLETIIDDCLDKINFNYESQTKNIKLISLSFGNMFSYNYGEIDFTKLNKIVGLDGPNHSGKSALIDILLYSIYGKCSRGTRLDILNKYNKTMFSRVELEVNGKNYKIERESKTTEKLKLYENNILINEDTKIKTEIKIEKIICEYDDLIQKNIILQKEAINFINLGSKEKRTLLQKIIRLDIFELLLKEVQTRSRSTKSYLEKTKKDSKFLSNKEYNDKINNTKQLIIKQSDQYEKILDNYNKNNKNLIEYEYQLKENYNNLNNYNKNVAFDKIDYHISNYNNDIDNFERNIQTIKNELTTLSNKRKTIISKIENKKQKLKINYDEINDKYHDINNEKIIFDTNKENKINLIHTNIQNLYSKKKTISKDIVELLNNKNAIIKELEITNEKINSMLIGDQNLDDKYIEYKNKKNNLLNKIKISEISIDKLEENIKNLKNEEMLLINIINKNETQLKKLYEEKNNFNNIDDIEKNIKLLNSNKLEKTKSLEIEYKNIQIQEIEIEECERIIEENNTQITKLTEKINSLIIDPNIEEKYKIILEIKKYNDKLVKLNNHQYNINCEACMNNEITKEKIYLQTNIEDLLKVLKSLNVNETNTEKLYNNITQYYKINIKNKNKLDELNMRIEELEKKNINFNLSLKYQEKRNEIIELENMENELNNNYKKYKTIINNIKKIESDNLIKNKDYEIIKIKWETKQNEYNVLISNKKIETEITEIDIFLDLYELLKELNNQKEIIEKSENIEKSNEFIDSEIMILKSELKEIQSTRFESYEKYISIMNENSILENEINNLSSIKIKTEEEINNKNNYYKKLVNEIKIRESLIDKLNDILILQDKINNIRNILNNDIIISMDTTLNDLNTNKNLLIRLETEYSNYQDNMQNITKLENEKNILDKLIKILDNNGIVDNLLSVSILPELTSKINFILNGISDYKITIKYINKTIKIYKVVDNTDYLTDVMMLSGYEKDILNIVMRLAMIKISNDIKSDFIIIDEAFTYCDENNKKKLKNLFNFLRKNYKWTLLITHDKKIKEEYDMNINIKQDSLYSYMNYNYQANV